ncbi:alpha/beta fold hydrolase [Actinomyces ruminicola]|uniref:Lysophospholipase, alpha-beta hydrolase superfamily n=1 Tax=Actinomyces ruminicola TaxID=332524 RepID=A0A1G9Z2T1_9ACTO|nr:alpha/beta hydrolase [Actinomyces ruminicola]SDN15023.1 Lysophospholipase, alpha-beta hydrolase superfamily [Actinomyces ruminicola]
MPLPLARIVAGPATAPTLVLLHGITGSAVSQADAIDHWAGRGYRVVAADARGHGLSPRWTPAELARAGDVLVDDVIDLLEELAVPGGPWSAGDGVPAATRNGAASATSVNTAGSGRPVGSGSAGIGPVLIGHSMGAATAMVAAVRRPELVGGVVLLDPARYGTRTQQELRERGAARKRARAAELADLPGAVARALADPEIPDDEAVVGVWAGQRVDTSLLDTGVVAPPVPWEEAMAELKVPALLVTGDRPGSARVGPAGLDVLARLANPQVETALVPGAGHDVRRTRPEGFWAVVDPWVDRLLG